jgi:thiamine kinase-like enzyme
VDDAAALDALLRRVPGWESGTLAVEAIDTGITNRNFRVSAPDGVFVVRIPGDRTELLGIDRAGEAEAAARAAALGVGPPVRGELPGQGTLVTTFVAGRPATAADLAEHHRLRSVVELVRRFHDSGPLRTSFPIFRVVEWHGRDAVANGAALPAAFASLHAKAGAIEAAVLPSSRPCHNDLLPANVLFGPDRTWLIDFEYAGMNDLFFDLGNLSVNAALDDDADDALLVAYFGDVRAGDRARLRLMKIMSEFREGMWAVVQSAISTLTNIDFTAYADEHLETGLRLATAPDFERLCVEANT